MLFRKKEKSDRDLEVNPFYKDKNALIVYIKSSKCSERYLEAISGLVMIS